MMSKLMLTSYSQQFDTTMITKLSWLDALHRTDTTTIHFILHILQVCGVYLSFFFMLSHNFVEARTFEHSKGLDGGDVEYLSAVLQTTSNVGGKVSALYKLYHILYLIIFCQACVERSPEIVEATTELQLMLTSMLRTTIVHIHAASRYLSSEHSCCCPLHAYITHYKYCIHSVLCW